MVDLVVAMVLSRSATPSAPQCEASLDPRPGMLEFLAGLGSRFPSRKLSLHSGQPSMCCQGLRSSRVSGRPGGMALIRKPLGEEAGRSS